MNATFDNDLIDLNILEHQCNILCFSAYMRITDHNQSKGKAICKSKTLYAGKQKKKKLCANFATEIRNDFISFAECLKRARLASYFL